MFLTILAYDRPITYVWGMNTWDKRRAEYKEFKKYYYHLSSDGWKEGLLFHTKEQYAYGMTVMGLVTLKYGIVIYDFSLMPNHFHIILKGNGNQCLDAFDYLRMKISSRFRSSSLMLRGPESVRAAFHNSEVVLDKTYKGL